MVTSILRNEAGGWETVKRKGDRRKQEAEPKKQEQEPKKQVAADPAPVASTVVKNAFDALVEKEATPAGLDKSKVKVAGSDVDTPGTPPQSQEQNSTVAATQGKAQKDKPRKDKKKLKKKGKGNTTSGNTTSQTTGKQVISLPNLEDAIREVESKYPANVAAQVESITDELLPAFKDILDLTNVIRKKPYNETTTIADGHMDNEASDMLSDFLKKKPVTGVCEALCVILRALFDACEGANGCKGQAGVVIMVSMIAQANPVAVIRAMEQIVYDGARFTSPTRLPFLLWVFGQAERGACGAYLACWLRLLLPQLIGSPLKDPAAEKKKSKKKPGTLYQLEKKSAAQATSALDCALNGGKNTFFLSEAVRKAGGTGLPYRTGTSQMYESVVSVASYDKILNVIRKPDGLPPKIAETLAALNRSLISMVFSPALNDPAMLQGVVPMTLALAGKSAGNYLGPGDIVVASAAKTLITCLQSDSESFEVWAVNHKNQIRGSCRILQHLAHSQPKEFTKMMKNPSVRDDFLITMRNLQERHGFLLAQDKGWQAECAKGAHEATKKFLDVKSRAKGSKGPSISTRAIFVTCITIGIVSVVAMSYMDEIKEGIAYLKDTEAGEKVDQFFYGGPGQVITDFVDSAVSKAKEIGEGVKAVVSGGL